MRVRSAFADRHLAIAAQSHYVHGMTEYQVIEADETVYRDGTIKLHVPDGYEGMRKAGRLAAEILDELTTFVQPGVTTGEIDDKARTMMLDAGAVPATMGYRGYAHSCCT